MAVLPSYVHVNQYLVIYNLLKSIDFTNFIKSSKYMTTSSLFSGGQLPPLVITLFNRVASLFIEYAVYMDLVFHCVLSFVTGALRFVCQVETFQVGSSFPVAADSRCELRCNWKPNVKHLLYIWEESSTYRSFLCSFPLRLPLFEPFFFIKRVKNVVTSKETEVWGVSVNK
jgi:hypothetical protein